MSSTKFTVDATANFRREAKRLAKKYASLKAELYALDEHLAANSVGGASLGRNCYKIRLKIAS